MQTSLLTPEVCYCTSVMTILSFIKERCFYSPTLNSTLPLSPTLTIPQSHCFPHWQSHTPTVSHTDNPTLPLSPTLTIPHSHCLPHWQSHTPTVSHTDSPTLPLSPTLTIPHSHCLPHWQFHTPTIQHSVSRKWKRVPSWAEMQPNTHLWVSHHWRFLPHYGACYTSKPRAWTGRATWLPHFWEVSERSFSPALVLKPQLPPDQ